MSALTSAACPKCGRTDFPHVCWPWDIYPGPNPIEVVDRVQTELVVTWIWPDDERALA